MDHRAASLQCSTTRRTGRLVYCVTAPKSRVNNELMCSISHTKHRESPWCPLTQARLKGILTKESSQTRSGIKLSLNVIVSQCIISSNPFDEQPLIYLIKTLKHLSLASPTSQTRKDILMAHTRRAV